MGLKFPMDGDIATTHASLISTPSLLRGTARLITTNARSIAVTLRELTNARNKEALAWSATAVVPQTQPYPPLVRPRLRTLPI